MFKMPALALAGFLMLASPALAQRAAPITQGTTSLDLAQQVTQVRQQNADLKVQLNGMAGDVMTLSGRVETLEFQLQQARNDNDALVRDNEALSDELGAIRAEMKAQARALQDLQARMLGLDSPDELEPEDSAMSAYPGALSSNPYPSTAGAGAGT